MKTKITIGKVYKKQVKTKNGMKESLSFLELGTQNWYSSFWNGVVAKWKEGDVVEFDYEVNGNFKNIKIENKMDSKQQGAQTQGYQTIQQDAAIHAKLDEILRILKTPFIKSPPGLPLDLNQIPSRISNKADASSSYDQEPDIEDAPTPLDSDIPRF